VLQILQWTDQGILAQSIERRLLLMKESYIHLSMEA
jgi:hypothetical protein